MDAPGSRRRSPESIAAATLRIAALEEGRVDDVPARGLRRGQPSSGAGCGPARPSRWRVRRQCRNVQPRPPYGIVEEPATTIVYRILCQQIGSLRCLTK